MKKIANKICQQISLFVIMFFFVFLNLFAIVPFYSNQNANATSISPVTQAASAITSSDATLGGITGSYGAEETSFWVSESVFSTSSSVAPSGVYNVLQNNAISADKSFSALLSSTGISITPNTTYYFTARSLIDGTWQFGEILNFTTVSSGSIFIDTNGNGILDPGEPTFLNIQSAIANASSGNIIHILAGTYTEIGQIVISKNLTIIGASKTTTIIKPDADYNNGWFLVNAGITFNLSRVALDGTGHAINKAIVHKGNGIIDNNKFTGIKNGSYAGTAIAIDSTDNVDIINNEFTNIGRNGILADHNTGTISGNTYTGKGPGDWLDYFILSEYGDNITISNNVISNNVGLAFDGSSSAAIVIWDDPNTQATIVNNTMTNNTTGIAVASFSGGTSSPKVVIGEGNLFNGGEYGIALQTWGTTYDPDITFVGPSTFKNQSNKAIYVYDGVLAGKTIDISSVIFLDSNGNVITDRSAVEALLYDSNTGLLKWIYTAPVIVIPKSPTNEARDSISNYNRPLKNMPAPIERYYESSNSIAAISGESSNSTYHRNESSAQTAKTPTNTNKAAKLNINSGQKLLGLIWYWWLIIISIVILMLFGIKAVLRHKANHDLLH
jgi:hypothetical protein